MTEQELEEIRLKVYAEMVSELSDGPASSVMRGQINWMTKVAKRMLDLYDQRVLRPSPPARKPQ